MAEFLRIEELPEPLLTRYRHEGDRIANIRRFTDGHAELPVDVIKVTFITGNLMTHKWKSVNGGKWVPFGSWFRPYGDDETPARDDAPTQDVHARAAALRERFRVRRV